MDVPLNVEVHCSDGANGRSTAIVVEPRTKVVTHFVVEAKGVEYLVPIDAIAASDPHHIQLRWSWAELAQAQPFDRVVYVGDSEPGAASSVFIPYTLDQEYMVEAVDVMYQHEEQVPANELALHRGAWVEASDGRVGQIDEFVIDQATGQITHVVLRHGHLWGKREIAVPLSAIDHVLEDVVYVNLDKAAVEHLPGVSGHG